MKFNEKTIEEATSKMCEDPFWADLYENAPEGAKKRLRVAFWGNAHMREREDLDAYRVERERIEREEMTYEDAMYLARRFPEGAGKTHYAELAERIARRPMMTDAKLDAAIDALAAMLPAEDRALVAASRERYDRCEDGFFTKELFWKAVGGDGDSCGLVGDCFAHGHGVDPDPELALYWFRRGAFGGDADCCLHLAYIHEKEDSGHFDMPAAVFWMMEALRRGDADAKRNFGYRLALGEGPWERYRNPKAGVALITEATQDDPHGYAYYNLALCFERGAGVERNMERALELYMEARRRGHYAADDAISRIETQMAAADEGAERKPARRVPAKKPAKRKKGKGARK